MTKNHKIKIKNIIFLVVSILFIAPFLSLAETHIHDVQTMGFSANEDQKTVLLKGSANDAQVPTMGYFRYSTVSPIETVPLFCNNVYGSGMKATKDAPLGLCDPLQLTSCFQKEISGLKKNTKYYYCAMASDANVIEGGGVKFFATSPMIETDNAQVSGTDSAYLNGFYATMHPAQTWFEYANVPNDNTITPDWKTVNIIDRNTQTADNMQVLLTGLSEDTSYEFRAALKNKDTGFVSYGSILTFKTDAPEVPVSIDILSDKPCAQGQNCDSKEVTIVDVGNENKKNNFKNSYKNGNVGNNNENGKNGNNQNNNPQPHKLGEIVSAPTDAIVHKNEGIETVFSRQIIKNSDLAEEYGYTDGKDLKAYSWIIADILAREFGYVNSKGKEIRVSKPDIAAYELQLKDGILTVYEYYNSKIVNIQSTTESLRSKYYYEYYYSKKGL